MRISINKDIAIPIYIQIKNEIRDMIHSGILPKDFSLPPERKLALSLGVSRSTVIKAYEELKALGLVESYMGKGTIVVTEISNKVLVAEKNILPLSWYQFFDEKISATNDHVISDVINIVGQKDIISFAAGVGDPNLYPAKELQELQNQLWKISGGEMLNISAVEGYYPLRESISELLKLRHITASPKEIMMLSGSMQGLDFAAKVFIKPGDVIIVEEPTFLGALQIFRLAGAKIIGVPLDEDGIRTDVLEALLVRYKPKFIYTVPTFQNPTGIVMSIERRCELLELAYKYQVPIIEDDPYGELRYEGTFIPPLKALDKYDYVLYLSTFSKIMFSGGRVGWIVAPKQVIKKFSLMKQMTDLHVNTPSQYLLDSFLRNGLYEKHLNLICREYSHKRDLMLKALKENSNPNVSYNIPIGGYFIWCTLPKEILQTKLIVRSASKGVIYTPGYSFYPDGSEGSNCVRLNFTFEVADNISKGIKLLMQAVNEVQEEVNGLIEDIECYKKPMV